MIRHIRPEVTAIMPGRKALRWSARAIIYPSFGHCIPVEVRDKVIDPFIDEVLQKWKLRFPNT